ncbi:MAG: methyltransferase domain-containing protein, partial [Lachnospiraceae bacterium]|nr:methyltransferase domain-containing protein [Lachnospiraceae bacterium]
ISLPFFNNISGSVLYFRLFKYLVPPSNWSIPHIDYKVNLFMSFTINMDIQNISSNKVSNSKTVFTDESEDRLFRLEDESWWFQYRAQVIIGMMSRYFTKEVLTVDIGGGNGYTTSAAAKKGFNMLLMEPSEKACKNGRQRGLKTDCAMMTESYPENGSFTQVLLLDVLEHIQDDEGFVRMLGKKMRDGGYFCLRHLLLNVCGAVRMITPDIFVDTG